MTVTDPAHPYGTAGAPRHDHSISEEDSEKARQIEEAWQERRRQITRR